MIEAFSLKTAHLFGDALASQARLRYRVFVQQRALPHPFYDGMEYDEFDTPAAVYLVWRDPHFVVRGLIRLVPTSVPYMVERYWPHLFETREQPKSDKVLECSRVCVDRGYDSGIRPVIMPQLLSAGHEFCVANGIDAVVGVTRKHLIGHFLRTGLEWLGEEREIEGEREAAFWAPTEHLRPVWHCAKYRIPNRVLSLEPLTQRIAA